MTSNLRFLPSNAQGKDYVIGDLHGCYELLERLLIEVRFDKNRDRLFSVGDLIDRGPKSLGCLQLLSEPWFFAVKGNHEQMMLEFFKHYWRDGRIEALEDVHETGFLDCGGSWAGRYLKTDQRTMSEEFNRCMAMVFELPLLIVVGEGQHRFHIVHAELVRPHYRETSPIVYLDEDIDYWLEQQTIPAESENNLLWGRTLMSSSLIQHDILKMHPGLSTTFCGHTFAAKPQQTLSHICVDTGAFISYAPEFYGAEIDDDFGLTLFDVQSSRWFISSYQFEGVRRRDY